MRADYKDHMGNDLTVVNAARVSFDKESEWDDRFLEILKSGDHKLISYLAKHNHWTPFGHCAVTIREKVPIFVARQRFKHTVGFVYNEVSRRYVSDAPEFFAPNEWRGAPTDGAKQGSSDALPPWEQKQANRILEEVHEFCEKKYYELLGLGTAPEMARMVLPQSMYTEYWVTGSLAAWARAYNLRIDGHAQKEIRDLSVWWDEIIAPLYPISWNALTKNG